MTHSLFGKESHSSSTPNYSESYSSKGCDSKASEKYMQGWATCKATEAIETTQWRKWHTKSGHGFSAEDANYLSDYLRGKQVNKTGLDNSLHGPDRISDGIHIQTKYCAYARKSVNAAFQSSDGMYQYSGQILEVPKDQYQDAVRLMAEKIRDGKVPGYTDPADAVYLVKRGSVTYRQAVQIAKAGNLESLKFDAKNQAVTSSCVGGLSFVISFLHAKSKGASDYSALQSATKCALRTATTTMATGVITQQLLRTTVGRTSMAATESVMKQGLNAAMKTATGKKVIEKTASAVGRKAVESTAARNVLTRTMSSNVATAVVAGVVTSIPDTINVCRGKISPKQYGKNLVENGVGIGGGCAGSWGGAAIGSCICPGIGTAIGGFVGGIIGGLGGSSLMKSLLD